MKAKQTTQVIENHPMRKIKIEKIILSCGATGPDLEKAKKLLEILSNRKANKIASAKRIPNFKVNPGLEVGTRVTIRGEEASTLLRRLLGAVDNLLKKKQVTENHFSFGIHEYIEIPGTEYQRDIGIKGLNVTVVFVRPGLRVKRKKIKAGTVPKKQFVTKQEIIDYMGENFKTKFK
ncbi:MAG: 50S ribosomal protein L5 [Nanoarchaeota archaeon]|nr:50S ribosomal protein L5 [Nanoarchaeota archaeon]